MNISDIKKLYNNSGRGFYNIVKFKHPKLYIKLKNGKGRTIPESLYLLMNECNQPMCTVCKTAPARFISIKNGYTDFCNKKCYEMVHGARIKEIANTGVYKNVGKKAKSTFLKNGGNYNDTVARGRITKKEKYGDENYNNRDKCIATNIKRYGTKVHPNVNKSTISRINSNQIGFKSEKYKQYLKDNGVENASQIQSVRDKKAKSNFKRMMVSMVNGNRLQQKVIPLFTIDDYVGQHTMYPFECSECGNKFADKVLNGKIPRCLSCNPLYSVKSLKQREVYDYINTIYNGEILYNCRSVLSNNNELDIYIPEKNIAIEYNGNYWHSELLGKDKKYHIAKTEECEKLGIQLIHIFEDEWLNKEYIVKNRIKYILNVESGKLYARNCTIKEISASDKNKFLLDNHLQGPDKSKIKLGAFYDNELVSVMTFGGLRRALGSIQVNNHYELYRFCSKIRIIGIASKLLTYFIRNYSPEKIITYADRRWSNGKLYEAIGFTKVSNGTPNYWYLDGNMNRIHRYTFRKGILSNKLADFNPQLTEWQNMQRNGYNRIWDCGSLKFQLNLKT